MSYITTRKRQLDRAFKDYKNNQRGKAKAKKRLDICQTKYSEITNRTTVSARNIVVAGMLYFDERKREELLAEAEQLNYSRETLNRLRIFNSGNWNEDTVDCDTIIAFSAIEDYVNNNSPSWKKSPLYSIEMSDETFSEIIDMMNSNQLADMKYILALHYPQKTQSTSLLVDTLLSLPSRESQAVFLATLIDTVTKSTKENIKESIDSL